MRPYLGVMPASPLGVTHHPGGPRLPFAWLYPPGVNIRLSGNCCFGAGNWSPNFFESLPTNLREVLENWADLLADDIFVHDVSSPGSKVWAITLEDAAANIDVLANRLDKVLSDLRALESEVDPENLTSS